MFSNRALYTIMHCAGAKEATREASLLQFYRLSPDTRCDVLSLADSDLHIETIIDYLTVRIKQLFS